MDLGAINWENISLSLAAIAAVIALWRDNQKLRENLKASEDAHKNDLREYNKDKLYELTARVMVVEDRLDIKREERVKYLPPGREVEKAALTDMVRNSEKLYSDDMPK